MWDGSTPYCVLSIKRTSTLLRLGLHLHTHHCEEKWRQIMCLCVEFWSCLKYLVCWVGLCVFFLRVGVLASETQLYFIMGTEELPAFLLLGKEDDMPFLCCWSVNVLFYCKRCTNQKWILFDICIILNCDTITQGGRDRLSTIFSHVFSAHRPTSFFNHSQLYPAPVATSLH